MTPGLRHIRSKISCWRYGARSVDPTTYLTAGSKISRDVVIGAYGYIGPGASICPRVTIGNYVMFGPKVTIVGQDHNYDIPGTPSIFSGRPDHPATALGHDVWVATGAIILAGVTIGNGAIIAAGAVVTKDVPAYAIMAGVPAKQVNTRFSDDDQATHNAMLERAPEEGTYCGPIKAGPTNA